MDADIKKIHKSISLLKRALIAKEKALLAKGGIYETESNIEKIDWDRVWKELSKKPGLSEDFIREFQDKLDWATISRYQKLSEKFIREFRYKVYWPSIIEHQELSEGFIREFRAVGLCQ